MRKSLIEQAKLYFKHKPICDINLEHEAMPIINLCLLLSCDQFLVPHCNDCSDEIHKHSKDMI